MTEVEYDREWLGAAALGILTAAEQEELDRHLICCEFCRAELAEFEDLAQLLRELPPEMLLTGPPEDTDLLLHRTVRTIRVELAALRRRRALTASLVAAGVFAAALGGGALIGRSASPRQVAGPQTSAIASAPIAGTVEGSGSDPATGAALTVQVVPAVGWVRVKASVRGIAAGEDCRLIVVRRNGTRAVAGGWITSEKGRLAGTVLDGAAAVAPADVAAVEIENSAGKRFVAVRL